MMKPSNLRIHRIGGEIHTKGTEKLSKEIIAEKCKI
jgi:hypothetical protein